MVLQKIEIRHTLDKDLTELTTTIDHQSWAACQDGGGIGPIKELVNDLTVSLFNDFENSDLNPNTEQLDWLQSRLAKLHGVLHNRGEEHIEEKYSDSLHVKGGTGYTQRFLGKDWSVYKNNLCVQPIPTL